MNIYEPFKKTNTLRTPIFRFRDVNLILISGVGIYANCLFSKNRKHIQQFCVLVLTRYGIAHFNITSSGILIRYHFRPRQGLLRWKYWQHFGPRFGLQGGMYQKVLIMGEDFWTFQSLCFFSILFVPLIGVGLVFLN